MNNNCGGCNGSGRISVAGITTWCDRCNGTGDGIYACENCSGVGHITIDGIETGCAACTGSGYNNQTRTAMDELIKYQIKLGDLGFTLNSDRTYSKEYATADGRLVRLSPNFDKGISLDSQYALSSFTVITVTTVPVVNGSIESGAIPKECASDISALTYSMSPKTRDIKEDMVVTAVCSVCSKQVSSFMFTDSKHYCLSCI